MTAPLNRATVAEWEAEYLPSEAQERIRIALGDEDGNGPPLDMSTDKPATNSQ